MPERRINANAPAAGRPQTADPARPGWLPPRAKTQGRCGTKVSERPVEFPTSFKLVVNMNAASLIGLTVPESVLLRADEVIE
jgi:hypothetical protein